MELLIWDYIATYTQKEKVEKKNRGRAEKSRLKAKPKPKRRRVHKAGEDLLSKYYGSWKQKEKAEG